MGEKPLEVLKTGLTRLKVEIKTRKNALSAHLSNKEHIAEEDEH
jgi:hypothetical protein